MRLGITNLYNIWIQEGVVKLKRVVLIVIIILLLFTAAEKTESSSLFIYCGAGFRAPMEDIAREFSRECNVDINYQFNGSGTLISQIKISRSGDLFLPGDNWYIEELGSDIDQQLPVVYHTPVLITPTGNSAGIKKISDLIKREIGVILGDRSAAIGRVSEKIFNNVDIREEDLNIVATMGTVNQVALGVAMSQADAGIVWQANYRELESRLEMIEIPEEINIVREISIGLLDFSKNKEDAVRFMEFVASSRGQKIFTKYGYKIADDGNR